MNGVPFLLCASLVLLAGCDNREPQATPPAAAVSVGTAIDDGITTTRVKSALLGETDTRSFDIKVETRGGEVMLSGFVASQAHVERALSVARGVEGVKSVLNKMDLKEGAATVGSTVDDGIVTARVKSALLGEPGIKSLDIAVVTRKGEAQLSGFVDNQSQIDQASGIARGVPGVVSVSSEMSIKK